MVHEKMCHARSLRAFAVSSWVSLAASCAGMDAAGPAFDEADGGTVFPTTPGMSMPSRDGHYFVELRTAPEPQLRQGENRVQFLVMDKHERPVSHLELALVPFMPAMGHASPVEPVFADEDVGRYEFRKVWLNMPGRWQLITALDGDVADEVIFDLDVD